jgi:FkbM family methyltransferase
MSNEPTEARQHDQARQTGGLRAPGLRQLPDPALLHAGQPNLGPHSQHHTPVTSRAPAICPPWASFRGSPRLDAFASDVGDCRSTSAAELLSAAVLGDAATTKARVASYLTRDDRASRALERAGAFTLADRLDEIRTGGDVIAIPLPLGPGQLRAHRIKLLGFEGRDTAVQAIRKHGWRGFEEPTPEMLVRAVRAFAGLVYDVGANSGIYALLAVEARPEARVIAFEPFPPALEALRANLSLNRSGSRVEVVASAVSDSSSTALLHVPTHIGCIETSASLNSRFKADIETTVEVPTTTLDDDWRRRGRPRVSVIKIDTETTEYQVLRGASELVREERPIIFYELLPGGNAEAIREFAEDHRLLNVRMTGTTATVEGTIEHDPRGWNQVLVPAERRDDIVPLLEATDLLVTYGADRRVGQDADTRSGSGEAVIERVDLVGADGLATTRLATGDAVTVSLTFVAHKRIELPVFGIAISTEDGLLVTGPNTSEATFDCEAIEGKGVVELSVDRLLLLSGTYDLTVSLYDQSLTYAYDFQRNVLQFKVDVGVPRETSGGVMTLEGRWTVRGLEVPT